VGVAGVWAFSVVSARTREFGRPVGWERSRGNSVASVMAEGAVMAATAGSVEGAACGYVLVAGWRGGASRNADASALPVVGSGCHIVPPRSFGVSAGQRRAPPGGDVTEAIVRSGERTKRSLTVVRRWLPFPLTLGSAAGVVFRPSGRAR